MSENEKPDWLAELAKGSEVTRRQIEPIIQAAQQFVRDARQAKTSGGPALPFAQRIALAVDAGMREFLPPGERHVVGHSAISGTAAMVSVTAVAGLASGRGLALPPLGSAGRGAVENRPRGLAALNDGEIVFLVLVWLYAFVLPWFGAALPPEFHAVLSDHYGTTAIALAITWRVLDKHK